jgi:hypothetical protein
LKDGITPVTYYPFINFNDNSQLSKFGAHNGGAQDRGLLNEKWESLALVPIEEGDDCDDYFLFSLSDNDFRQIDGKSPACCIQQETSNSSNSACQQRQDRVPRHSQFGQPGSCIQGHSAEGCEALCWLRTRDEPMQ